MPDLTPSDPDPGGPDDPADVRAADRSIARRALAPVLGAALVVVLLVLVVVQQRRIGDLEDEVGVADDVRLRAAEFAEAYLTFDSTDVRASLEAVLPFLTEEFAREYEADRSPAVEELFAGLETSTEVDVVGVYLADLDRAQAQVLVVIDLEATSAAAGTQRLRDLSLVVDLERADGSWLVSAVGPGPRPSSERGDTAPVGGDASEGAPPTTAPDATTPPTTLQPGG